MISAPAAQARARRRKGRNAEAFGHLPFTQALLASSGAMVDSSPMKVRKARPWIATALVVTLLGLGLYVPPAPQDWVDEGETPPEPRPPSPGSRWDCELLARSLRAQTAPEGGLSTPLMVDDGDRICRWSYHGLVVQTVSEADFDAVSCGPKDAQGRCTQVGYLGHVLLDRPRYALLPLRAEVDGGYMFDWVGGGGWTCYYVNLLVRWQFLGCADTWAS